MTDEQTHPAAEGALRTALEKVGVKRVSELAAKLPRDVMADLDRLPIPPSEAILGALVLNVVHELHQATQQLDQGTSRLLSLTRMLVVLAGLTLAASIVTLAVTIIK